MYKRTSVGTYLDITLLIGHFDCTFFFSVVVQILSPSLKTKETVNQCPFVYYGIDTHHPFSDHGVSMESSKGWTNILNDVEDLEESGL